mmetsp:Transcript_26121/g.46441  ORF Transcript_26121/g.46441 Transcript_26121/m.46441 type:complete len:327 (-) Transcript_26121:271-1251(-)
MIKQPGTQILLTNVVVVRLKHKGKRFELACYPNKVNAWREGLEKDLDEVLQLQEVYSNVSKGKVVQRKQLKNEFPELQGYEAIIKHILENGELQVSELERNSNQDAMLKDIANIISKMTISEATGLPVPSSLIQQAIKDAHYNVKLKKSAKFQALQVMKKLNEPLGLTRAKMRLRIVSPIEHRQALAEVLQGSTCESDQVDRTNWTAVFLIDPELFRHVTEVIKKYGWTDRVSCELLDQAVTQAPKVVPKVVVEETKVEVPRVGLHCSNCPGAEFTDKQDHRAHFKTTWHRVNLKRKLRNLEGLGEAEFSLLSPDEIEAFLAFKSS